MPVLPDPEDLPGGERPAHPPPRPRPAPPLAPREQEALGGIEDDLTRSDPRLADRLAELDGFASAPLPPIARCIIAIAVGLVALATASVLLPTAGWVLVVLVAVVLVVLRLLLRPGAHGPGR